MNRLKRINKAIMLIGIIFFNLSLNKKIINNPNKNKINGILFPENIIPKPNRHKTKVVKLN